jgi:hypothetical protein
MNSQNIICFSTGILMLVIYSVGKMEGAQQQKQKHMEKDKEKL